MTGTYPRLVLAHIILIEKGHDEIRACERSLSGAENGAERVKNSWSGSGAVSGLLKKSRSVSGAWSGMNYPLKFRSNHLNFGLHKSQ